MTVPRLPVSLSSPIVSGRTRSGRILLLLARPFNLAALGVIAPARSSVCSSRSVPYPQETEIIANVTSSPHHLGATMVTERTHRMTELFSRLAPGKNLDQARGELRLRVHDDQKRSSGGLFEAGGLSDFGQDASRSDHFAVPGPCSSFCSQRQPCCSSLRVPMSRTSSSRVPCSARRRAGDTQRTRRK